MYPQAPMDMFTHTSVAGKTRNFSQWCLLTEFWNLLEMEGTAASILCFPYLCVCACVYTRVKTGWQPCPDWSSLIRLTWLAMWDPVASSYPALVSPAQATTLSIFTQIPRTQPRASCFWKEHLLISLPILSYSFSLSSPSINDVGTTHCVAQASFECSVILLSHSTKC